jgi:hypothetical protein
MASQSKSSSPASPATEQAPDPIPNLAITFGIEFECVLTSHESKLHRVLEDNGIVATVRKDLLPQEHTACLLADSEIHIGGATSPAGGSMSLPMSSRLIIFRYIAMERFDPTSSRLYSLPKTP